VGPFSSAEEHSAWRRQDFVWRGGHVDAEYCLQHWQETPREIFLQLWLCLEDWTEEKGALRIIPATHTLIAAANSALPEPPPSRLAGVHGKPFSPAGSNGQRATDVGKRAVLPEDVRGVLQRMESRPVLARRGQAVAFTPGLLHDSSPNLSTDGVRKRLTFTYCPGTPEGGAPLVEMSEPAAELVAAMRELLPAERRHLLKAEPGPSSKL
jgi:ectoine hydroxylase-related dioxygenase (phytanoyl-CoA dioxygenase family)